MVCETIAGEVAKHSQKWMWLQCQRNTLPYKYSVNPSTARSHHCWLLSHTHTSLGKTVPVIAAKTAKASHLASLFAFSTWSCARAELFAGLQSKLMQVWATSAYICCFYYDGLCHKYDFALCDAWESYKFDMLCNFKDSYVVTNVNQMSICQERQIHSEHKIQTVQWRL